MQLGTRRPLRWRQNTALTSAALAMLLGGCGQELPAPFEDTLANTAEQTKADFEAWRAKHVVATGEGHFLVEGDLRMPDLATVRQYWGGLQENRSGLAIFRTAGNDAAWNRVDRGNITYCIRPSDFGTDYDRVAEFMYRAASGWESAANVRFVHVETEDSANCTRGNVAVRFNIERDFSFVGRSSSMGLPHYSRPNRYLALGPTSTWTDPELLAVLTHALGHALGFMHEHDTAPGCNRPTTSGYRPLTCYDGRSAMHSPAESGWLDPSRQLNFISQRDVEGAQAVYEAPTNVLQTATGTVYARQQSTGDLYVYDHALWRKVGGAGQAFVVVGDTLYGQSPGGGAPVRFLGYGNGWVTIGGPAGQIFECVGALCATDPTTGNVNRYNAATGLWAAVGGPGSRFAATTTQLFGIGPWQDDHIARWNGPGNGWTLMGDGARELIGGGTHLYRVSNANVRNNIQRYDGGTTWTQLGWWGRSFAASEGNLYVLDGNGAGIWRHGSGGWVHLDRAATRLFHGVNGSVLITDSHDIIRQNFPGSDYWEYLGKP